jgi:hypothetical protein
MKSEKEGLKMIALMEEPVGRIFRILICTGRMRRERGMLRWMMHAESDG